MKDYHQIVRLFKSKFHEYKVQVRRLKLAKDAYGDCTRWRGKFTIKISNELDENHAIDIFLHEWAHILAWDAPGDDHGAAWGKAYSRVYRIYLKDFLKL